MGKVDVVPLEVQYFAQTATGEKQEPNGAGDVHIEPGPTVFGLWRMLCVWLALIHNEGDAYRFSLLQGESQPDHFIRLKDNAPAQRS